MVGRRERQDTRVSADWKDARTSPPQQDARVSPDPQDAQVPKQQALRKPSWWGCSVLQVFMLLAWIQALSSTDSYRTVLVVAVAIMQVLLFGWIADVYRKRRGGVER